jgi:hypothetical protein
MVTISVNIREGAVSRQVRITAESIRRALEVAGEGRTGVSVEVVFPVDPEAYFGVGARAAEFLPSRAGLRRGRSRRSSSSGSTRARLSSCRTRRAGARSRARSSRSSR